MSLFHRIGSHNSDMRFFRLNPAEVTPSWQNIRLLNWGNTKDIYNVYIKVLKECNVRFHHVTHLRWSGMETASMSNLTENVVATMSKHIESKMQNSYLTELMPVVMLVMAGFKRTDSYFVPRTRLSSIGPYESIEKAVLACFPDSNKWKDEVNGVGGDKDVATSNFLYRTLPYITTVIIQDGVMWLNKFPNHPHSHLLRYRLGQPYVKWALDSRKTLEDIVSDHDCADISTLGKAATTAFESMTRCVQEFRNERIQDQNKMVTVLHGFQTQVNSLGQQIKGMHSQIANQQNVIVHERQLRIAAEQRLAQLTTSTNTTTNITPSTPTRAIQPRPAATSITTTPIKNQPPPTDIEKVYNEEDNSFEDHNETNFDVTPPPNINNTLMSTPRAPQHGTRQHPQSMVQLNNIWVSENVY